jgi:hypothetical protein
MITVLIFQPYVQKLPPCNGKVIIAKLHVRVVKIGVDIASSFQFWYYTIQDIHWGKLKAAI